LVSNVIAIEMIFLSNEVEANEGCRSEEVAVKVRRRFGGKLQLRTMTTDSTLLPDRDAPWLLYKPRQVMGCCY